MSVLYALAKATSNSERSVSAHIVLSVRVEAFEQSKLAVPANATSGWRRNANIIARAFTGLFGEAQRFASSSRADFARVGLDAEVSRSLSAHDDMNDVVVPHSNRILIQSFCFGWNVASAKN